VTPTRLGIAMVLCCTFVGCGGGSHAGSPDNATIAQGNKTATCSGAIGGAGAGNWRPMATSIGRFGVYGTGRDFRTAQKQSLAGFSGLGERHAHGPILVTKTPFVVEGDRPLTVSISPPDRPRAGMVAGIPFGGGPYAEIRFVPCHDQPRTWWPAGWVLQDQDSITVSVREDNGPGSPLVVGRP
jgi:hypothetical protein